MVSSNGRWQVPGDSDKGNDPDSDFPIRQAFTDYAGRARHFVITFFRANLGFGVQAEEEGKDGQGYCFREFDPTSPYLALGRIQGRIRQALSVYRERGTLTQSTDLRPVCCACRNTLDLAKEPEARPNRATFGGIKGVRSRFGKVGKTESGFLTCNRLQRSDTTFIQSPSIPGLPPFVDPS
jgi:hypothetical protein